MFSFFDNWASVPTWDENYCVKHSTTQKSWKFLSLFTRTFRSHVDDYAPSGCMFFPLIWTLLFWSIRLLKWSLGGDRWMEARGYRDRFVIDQQVPGEWGGGMFDSLGSRQLQFGAFLTRASCLKRYTTGNLPWVWNGWSSCLLLNDSHIHSTHITAAITKICLYIHNFLQGFNIDFLDYVIWLEHLLLEIESLSPELFQDLTSLGEVGQTHELSIVGEWGGNIFCNICLDMLL